MCGIVGSACAPHESREWISNATLALNHRGPDDHGWVQIDDIKALSSALGLSYRQIVAIVNRIHLFFPCSMERVSKRALATAFPAIRRRFLEELNAEGGDWTDPSEFNWHCEDEFLPK